MSNWQASRFAGNSTNSQPKPQKSVSTNILSHAHSHLNDSYNHVDHKTHDKCYDRHNIEYGMIKNGNKFRKSRDDHHHPFMYTPNMIESYGQERQKKIQSDNSLERNCGSAKSKLIYAKQIEWLKTRKRERNDSKSKRQRQVQKKETSEVEIGSAKDLTKIKSQSIIYINGIEQKSSSLGRRPKQVETAHERADRRFSKIEYLEIINIKLEEEVKELKYRLENLEEDNNILLGRMHTLEAELSLSNKKIVECNSREDHHRAVETKLKDKIDELEAKLIAANNHINNKNELFDSGYNEGFCYNINYDREVLQKKNEEISRLNEIITKTRLKVNELNHFLSQEKLNNLQNVKNIEQEYQRLLEKKDIQLRELKKLTLSRDDCNAMVFSNQRRETENLGLVKEQSIKRVVTVNFYHKDTPNSKPTN